METVNVHAAKTVHQRDPYDRMIVAQAMTEPAYLYTVHRKLRRYSHFVRLA